MNIVRSESVNSHFIQENSISQDMVMSQPTLVEKSHGIGQKILQFSFHSSLNNDVLLSSIEPLAKGFEVKGPLLDEEETGEGSYITVAEGEDLADEQVSIAKAEIKDAILRVSQVSFSRVLGNNDSEEMKEMEQTIDSAIIGVEAHCIGKEEAHITRLNNQLRSLIGELKYQCLIEFIKQHGSSYVAQVHSSGKGRVVVIDNNQAIFTLSGKIYAYVNELGRGRSKITSRVVLVGSPNDEVATKKQLKIRACSLSQDQVPAKENQDEMQINVYLKEQSKRHNLSNVNVMKSIHLVNENQLAILMEVYDGNVDELLEENRLTEKDKSNIAAQMSQAIEQLHEIGIVHRDIKPDNFLYRFDDQRRIETVKITDFGTSSRIEIGKRTSLHKLFIAWSDPAWFDAELKKNHPDARFSKPSDIYQLGMTLCQIFIGYSITRWRILQEQEQTKLTSTYSISTDKDILSNWKKNPELWLGLTLIKDPSVRNMVRQMVDPNPDQRPIIQQVSDFFKQRNDHINA